MLDLVLLNVVFIVLPILVFLLYIVYENVINDKGKELFFSLAIATSIYLITKYSTYFEYKGEVIKILLLICLLKNKLKLSVLISLFMSLYLSFINNYTIGLLLIEYFILIAIFVIFRNLNKKYKTIIFLIIEIIFDIIYRNIVIY